MKTIRSIIQNHTELFLLTLLVAISTFSNLYYVSTEQNLLYGDALSRLNISRKIIDNLTPGLAQLGNVWLPLPQLLMLPFIWNNYLWHTGIAAAIMSTSAFILGSFYIYKSLILLTSSRLTAFFASLVYALNINAMYFQTTAMSETLFISCLSAIIYYSLAWSRTRKPIDLILWASFTSLITLVRYEGLAILICSIIYVFVYSLTGLKRRKAESNTILFSMLACLGFGLWTLYLTIIFGDPLYWKNYYAGPQVVAGSVETYTQNLPFLDSVYKFFVTLIWMNGIVPVSLAIAGFILIVVHSIRKKRIHDLSLLIPLSIFGFMVLTLMKNTPIKQPDLTLSTLLSGTTSAFPEFNIRYGIIMLPIVTIFFAYLFNIKYGIVKVVIVALFLVQLSSYIYPHSTIIFQLPLALKPREEKVVDPLLEYLRKNYDGGLIMISALKHDPQMFQLGLDYKTYIHEGTGKYWKDSIKDPSKYATWVVFYPGNAEDQVTRYLKKSAILKSKYDLVYSDVETKIFKIKRPIPSISVK